MKVAQEVKPWGALEERTRMESPRQTSQRSGMQGESRAELGMYNTPHPRKKKLPMYSGE